MNDRQYSHDKEQQAQNDSVNVDSLIEELGYKDGIRRAKAYHTLVAMGDRVVESLVGALSNRNELVRWQATKALDQINIEWAHHADSTTVDMLVGDLMSEDGLVYKSYPSLAKMERSCVRV